MAKDYSTESVQRLFTNRGVAWVDTHANVTARAWGICCPFCNDDSYHLGIFRDYQNWTCWRCGRSGPLWRLTERLFGVGRDQLELLLTADDFTDESALGQIHRIFQPTVEDELELPPDVILPPSRPIEPGHMPKAVQRFLLRRRFSVGHCVKYEARYAPMAAGGWSRRLVLPIRVDGYLVSCVGRALEDNAHPRYRNLPGINLKSAGALYGIDSWTGGRLILVEGPLDVWRLGDVAVATFGTSLTSAQRDRVWTMRPDELLVAWDGEAHGQALAAGRELLPLVGSVKVLRLPAERDPDDLGLKAIEEIADRARAL